MSPKLPDDIRTPAYVLDVAALKRNLETAARVKREAGVKILLATKAWAMPAAFPLLKGTLDGTTASGEYEARMGREEFGKEVHVYAPAYAPGEVERLTAIADHIYFNSPEQIARGLPLAKAAEREVGIRINPGYSNATLGGALYDPCAPNSRFGTTVAEIDQLPWDAIDIFHAHALCESLAEGSVGLIQHVAQNFAPYLRRVKAVNFGGGHFINKPGYDVGKLIAALKAFRAEFGVEVYLEPGAGLVVDTGYLVSTVIGMHRNERDIAILDASASTHMPDVLEVPYTPPVLGAEKPGVLAHSYILGGKTCMTGDIIGEYSFDRPLAPGSRVVFGDMMQYSFVKNTTFNGTPLPDLAMLHEDGRYEVVRSFGYEEFRRRLG
ncbi:carboxynorspermidine decarboxylase [uncultured Hyphomicrobium sp.]|uniref:carboxynorspermidine decarboxylase n=1 Tax=uncultured Hyphomicrobium sp. TaxID=194373 RepID=UPI0025E23B45|nr:carboxynorspermidine decarboxylase [uncultured Hyphomicrobium sp.]